MNKRVKQTLWLLVGVAVVYPVAIAMTTSFTPAGKGWLHFAISVVFTVFLFKIWSSFKNPTSKQVLGTILLLSGFTVALPLGIELVAFLPIFMKGVAHFLLVYLFIAGFVWVWRDEEKVGSASRQKIQTENVDYLEAE